MTQSSKLKRPLHTWRRCGRRPCTRYRRRICRRVPARTAPSRTAPPAGGGGSPGVNCCSGLFSLMTELSYDWEG
eukprot:763630-Pyramimonas_sp.AAC.1